MNHKVHNLAGIVVVESTLITLNQPLISWEAGVAMLGGYYMALLPDIDDSDSFMAKHQPFRSISYALESAGVKHRGITHSFIALFLVILLLALIPGIPTVIYAALTLAFASHLFLDLFTSAGLGLLYPLKFKFRMLPRFMAVSSDDNSVVQTLLYGIFTALFLVMTFWMLMESLMFFPLVHNLFTSVWGLVVGFTPDVLFEWAEGWKSINYTLVEWLDSINF